MGKRERRGIHRSREGSCNLSSMRGDSVYPDTRNESIARRDFEYARNSRILIDYNVDSGLGESTPQDFSSCCSSSADSTKHARVVRISFCLRLSFITRAHKEAVDRTPSNDFCLKDSPLPRFILHQLTFIDILSR